MPLVSVDELLKKAEAEGYAVGAFNCNNMEIVQAIVAAAEAEKAPVIIQASRPSMLNSVFCSSMSCGCTSMLKRRAVWNRRSKSWAKEMSFRGLLKIDRKSVV